MRFNDSTRPNHALQRTAPAVTLAASAAAFPPAVQPARQPPPSLSLEETGGNGVSVQLLDKCVPLVENGAWHAAFAFNPPGHITTSWLAGTVAKTFFMMTMTGGSSFTR